MARPGRGAIPLPHQTERKLAVLILPTVSYLKTAAGLSIRRGELPVFLPIRQILLLSRYFTVLVLEVSHRDP